MQSTVVRQTLMALPMSLLLPRPALAFFSAIGSRPSRQSTPSWLQSTVTAQSVVMKAGGRGQKRQTPPASPGGVGGGSRPCVGAGVGGNAVAGVSAGAAQSMSDVFKLNAGYLADLDVAWQKVTGHPVFQGIHRTYTSPIGMTGFDLQEFTTSIEKHGTYTCGGNLFWADLFYTGTPGVPINRRGAPVLVRVTPPPPPADCHAHVYRHIHTCT